MIVVEHNLEEPVDDGEQSRPLVVVDGRVSEHGLVGLEGAFEEFEYDGEVVFELGVRVVEAGDEEF